MAAAPLVRSLLAFACFALPVLVRGDEQPIMPRSINLNHCDEYLTGKVSADVVILDEIKIPPYQQLTPVNSIDNCQRGGKKLVGTLLVACDLAGALAPRLFSYGGLAHAVHCQSPGPCAAGLTVHVSQFCDPLQS